MAQQLTSTPRPQACGHYEPMEIDMTYKNYLTVPILMIVAALSTGAIAGDQPTPAVIELPDGTRSIKVSYTNVDLRKDDGVEQLNHRIKQAARTVCGFSYAHGWEDYIASRNCVRKAITKASNQVKVAVARARDGKQLAIVENSKSSTGAPR